LFHGVFARLDRFQHPNDTIHAICAIPHSGPASLWEIRWDYPSGSVNKSMKRGTLAQWGLYLFLGWVLTYH
jgi:hypothetical protein